MDGLKNYKDKLDKLDAMLSKIHSSHARLQRLKRSVHVLKTLLDKQTQIKSPYGPKTPIVQFSLQ